VKSSVSLCG